ncbi:MAG: FAD-dependent oxidoreductase, partial [Spirochaetales bacterium]|nr:FAD-dependent oxidoreductase [Spirochaetales bacterium]
MSEVHDVIVVGAGAVGCAVARELARYDIKVLVLEKECDVAYGTSGRMSGVVHAGFNNKVGALLARLCVEGSNLFEVVCRELDIPFTRTGKVLVAFDQDDMKALDKIIEQGKANGVEGLRLLDEDEIRAIAP